MYKMAIKEIAIPLPYEEITKTLELNLLQDYIQKFLQFIKILIFQQKNLQVKLPVLLIKIRKRKYKQINN